MRPRCIAFYLVVGKETDPVKVCSRKTLSRKFRCCFREPLLSAGRHLRHQLIPPLCIKGIEQFYAFAKRLFEHSHINRQHRQRTELKKFSKFRGLILFANHQVFNPDAPSSRPIHARFIREDIPWLDGYGLSARRNCHRPFMNIENVADTVTSSMAKVQPVRPKINACSSIDLRSSSPSREL